MKDNRTILMIADSENDSNMYYATGFSAPDPFIYIQKGKEKLMVMSDLELDRARSQARVDRVLSFSEYEKIARKKGIKSPEFMDVAIAVLKEIGTKRLLAPANFNVWYADYLRKKGFKLGVKKDPFFESREIKSEQEIQCIIKTQRAVEKAMDMAINYIKRSHIKDGFLYTASGSKITSESVKKLINIELIRNGFIARHTIVSCGDQTCEPHNVGSGPLKANEPIIIDIFPKDEQTGYYADITRTVVKGKASDSLKKMYKAVLAAQGLVFNNASNGARGDIIHKKVVKSLRDSGFKRGKIKGRLAGFFHGTGHGVGLDVHESPRIAGPKITLKTGNVVTVEPGLYYPGMGGVRVEDMILIKDNGCINLTEFPKMLEV